MNRRAFVTSTVAVALGRLLRAQQCALIAPGVVGCRTEISINQVYLAATLQQCPEWCWAASTEAIFKFFGHKIDQKAIVTATYGQVACIGAQKPIQIAQALSRKWTDDNGNDFRLRITAAYDPLSGVNAINNSIIVNEINNGRPLIYCNTHHCMVICGVDYRPSLTGPLIDAVGVMDPWPLSPTLHNLSQPELIPMHLGGQMMFLASVNVADA